MFSRVLKYEFAAWRRSYARFLIVIGLVFTLGCVVVALRMPIVSELALALPILAIMALPISQFVLVVVSYYRSLYGPRGYLTHTLPVPAGTLYAGKLVASMAALVVSGALMLAAIVLTTVALDLSARTAPFSTLRDALGALGRVPGLGLWIAGLGLLMLLSLFFNIISIFCAISTGSEARWQGLGIGGPVLVYVLIYVAGQLLTLGLMLTLPLGLQIDMTPVALAESGGPLSMPGLGIVSGNMLMAFWDAIREPNPLVATVGLGSFLAGPVLTAVCAWRTVRSIRCRTSLR
ncbi:MAG: hypothetical protein QM296_13315 [Bacillota bacterium]|nr:hypothetical protein [Bacillota bacterium]